MAWGEKRTATMLANVTAEKFFDDTPMLADEGLAACQVTVEFPKNANDDAIVRIYATLDDDALDWDTQFFDEHVIEKVSEATARCSFTVSGVYRFRVSVQSAGTLTGAEFSYRLSRQ
jgi:hypothetical protein